ncbi:uncharacterized protein LOC117112678 isoform X2 [Anneissia japonica]|nr:uncharacterized protein LOC117112678 isoform X2 [Anneissia japonica]
MTAMQFNILQSDFANWYDNQKCLSMLKVLFRDIVGNAAEKKSTSELLNDLCTQYYIGPDNLILLRDTISITKHFALGQMLKKKYPSFPDVKDDIISTQFTPHRQKLMKFGKKLTEHDVKRIDELYNSPAPKMYPDAWCMISDLEKNLKIVEGKMEEFYMYLEHLNLHLALNALKEELSTQELR